MIGTDQIGKDNNFSISLSMCKMET